MAESLSDGVNNTTEAQPINRQNTSEKTLKAYHPDV